MEYASVPVIVICCYIFAEIYKTAFRKKKDQAFKIIPVLTSAFGGLIAVTMFLTVPESIPSASNVWVALEIGLISGAGSTGGNQMIKQLFGKKTKKDGN
ncbi:MAG: phage holin family protein [Bacilli bacterium]|jgi:hypothetical protein|nr:phage holin family protein [Bacilli bacterium]